MSEKVIITGASSGIGRETAYRFSAERASLFLVARREHRLEEVAEQCRLKGASHVSIATYDLSNQGSGRELVEQAIARLEGLNVLVCNAGYGFFGEFEDLTSEQMNRMMQVNVLSEYESILAALPLFRDQQSGHIVLVSSIIGKKAMAYNASYCATKFAQVGLGEALWGELKKDGIGVTVVCPGYTTTEFHEVASPNDPNKVKDRPIQGQAPSVVAKAILKGVRKNKKEIHLTLPGKAILLIDRVSNKLSSWIMYRVALQDRKSR